MRRPFLYLKDVISSSWLTPCILGFFALLYIVIAFYNEEALLALMGLARSNLLLTLLLAMIPLNLLAVLCRETAAQLRRRNAALLTVKDFSPGPRQETQTISGTVDLEQLAGKIQRAGYQCRIKGDSCLAWKGVTAFPARLLFLLGCFSLFTGILLSLSTRGALRDAVIEGEPLPAAVGGRGQVEGISLRPYDGLLLSRSLEMEIASIEGEQKSVRQLGLYPPGRIDGRFLYPRYLGFAPLIRFTPPEPGGAFAGYIKLMIYPPGKEDGVDIANSPYRMTFVAQSEPGRDPYMTGDLTLRIRVMKGNQPVLEGTLPVGGSVSKGGYSLSFPQVKRMVAVDFVRDSGLPLVWLAALLFLLSAFVYLPIRLFAPRRDMVFVQQENSAWTASWAEGRCARHRGVFHGLLDWISVSNAP